MSTEPAKPESQKTTPATTNPITGLPATTGTTTVQTHHAKEGEGIGDRLGRGWERFKHGKVISYKWMALILLLVAGVGVGLYIRAEMRAAESGKWFTLSEQDTPDKLKQFAAQYPGTVQARSANFSRMKVLLNPQGIEAYKRAADTAGQKAAAANIEEARTLADQLPDEMKDDPIGRATCLLAGARAEQMLIGIEKEGAPNQYRGSVDKFVERINKLAEVAPDTAWGKAARTRADELKDPAARTRLVEYQIQECKLKPKPKMPAMPPGLGGMPPGMDIPGLPPLSGFPGGEPFAP